MHAERSLEALQADHAFDEDGRHQHCKADELCVCVRWCVCVCVRNVSRLEGTL